MFERSVRARSARISILLIHKFTRITYTTHDTLSYHSLELKCHEILNSRFALEHTRSNTGTTCTIKMRIPFKMEAPIAVYYRLTSFYQNYNSYFASRDSLQLMGENSDASTCAAVNSDYNRIGVTEENCDPATDAGCEYMFPCGLISNSMFNDTFTLETQSDSSSCTCATADQDQIPARFDCAECQTWPKSNVSLRTDDIYWHSDDDFFDAYVVFEREARESQSFLSLQHALCCQKYSNNNSLYLL